MRTDTFFAFATSFSHLSFHNDIIAPAPPLQKQKSSAFALEENSVSKVKKDFSSNYPQNGAKFIGALNVYSEILANYLQTNEKCVDTEFFFSSKALHGHNHAENLKWSRIAEVDRHDCVMFGGYKAIDIG